MYFPAHNCEHSLIKKLAATDHSHAHVMFNR